MARRRLNDLLPEDATADAAAMLEGALPPDTATTDVINDAQLAGLAEGGAAPVGADMGEALPPEAAMGALQNTLSIQDQQALQAELEEAAKRRLMGMNEPSAGITGMV